MGTEGMLPLYAITLGLSALLLFWVQPLYARLMLPLLGGASAVWITAMLFFQAMLLAGYLYAHLSVSRLGLRRQSLLHGLVLLVAAISLPVALVEGWTPPTGEMPMAWQIGLMAAGIGLPFFALSATAPLLQRWFAHSGHAESANPYFLYSASNLGSIAALIGYPILFEPLMGLAEQGWVWTVGYAALAVLIALCGVLLWRRFVANPQGVEGETLELSPEISWRRRLHWIVLTFVPSSLMLGVTTHLTTNVASLPLIWIVPLLLYLLTFVIVFARRPLLKHAWMVRLQPLAMILLALSFMWNVSFLWFDVPFHLGAFFVTAMVCHGELAKRRPAATQLTEFYLWMSVGGVLGGVFNGVFAPFVFSTVLEYPLVVVVACALRPVVAGGAGRWVRRLDIALPAVAAVLLIGVPWAFDWLLSDFRSVAFVGLSVVAALIVYSFNERPLRFALGIAVIIAANSVMIGKVTLIQGPGVELVSQSRNFFGVLRVYRRSETPKSLIMVSGTTLHGVQMLDPARRKEPLGYFLSAGPLGQVFGALAGRDLNRVGAIGLGAGSVACYARPGQDWTFFEIDPAVVEVARNTGDFTYLSDCAPGAKIVLGDARLSLHDVPDGNFDFLIVDAFTSDAIPMHLVTREALALYGAKTAPGGLIMFHISSRYFDLAPIIGRLAESTGMRAWLNVFPATPEDVKALRFGSIWMGIARDGDFPESLESDPRWQPYSAPPGTPLWTDDYSNIVTAIQLNLWDFMFFE